MKLVKTLRWFGQKDPITLQEIRQTGATGIVTALHHIPNGEVWHVEEILKTKYVIEEQGLSWEVVESLPVHEEIKKGGADRDRLIENYQQSIRNLGKCGIQTICYNFMPVLDWARTNLHYRLSDGAEAMYFDRTLFAAFDLYILKRPDAELDYSMEEQETATKVFLNFTPEQADELTYNIIVKTQSFIDGAVGEGEKDPKGIFLRLLSEYENIDREQLRKNFAYFLKAVIPVAEESGVRLAVHPDDPPFPLLGLPRIVSIGEDFRWLAETCPSLNNGITFCTGSLGARKDNDIVSLFREFGERVHFLHLRNTMVLENGDFYEAAHLEGGTDMAQVMEAIVQEQMNRSEAGRTDINIPMRPDHGHKLLGDFNREANPGYPLIGRMRGLAELSGLEMGIRHRLAVDSIT
ncbi:mannonate dehydratase [Limibacter armeniacum]|uniref:mannonate dehydratase n=1 Tax=Limibacter armeniacum TaxID=466084 RepID=UPI002FE500F2